MKTLLIVIAILFEINLNAQADSSKLTPSVVLQARDIEYFVNFTTFDVRFNRMDSVFVTKLNGANPPSGVTNVTCDGIQARHWLVFFEMQRANALSVDQGVWGRLKTALNATPHTWLTSRIITSDNTAQNTQSDLRSTGRKRARKELDQQ